MTGGFGGSESSDQRPVELFVLVGVHERTVSGTVRAFSGRSGYPPGTGYNEVTGEGRK